MTTSASSKPVREVTGPVREAGFVGYIAQGSVPRTRSPVLPGLDVRELSADAATGRLAAHADFPRGWRLPAGHATSQSLQVFVLEGALRAGTDTLVEYSLLHVSPGRPWPELEALEPGRALVFLDPPVPGTTLGECVVVHGSRLEWKPGTLGQKLGLNLPIEVKLLWKDAATGARTWLAGLKPGDKLPWEKHSVVQEGYLLEGDDRVAESIGGEVLVGCYHAGGYFYRPPGIVHMGPLSGTETGAVWLLRAPSDIDLIIVPEP
jgi:quercetin dioxygenase-like cupin family protein